MVVGSVKRGRLADRAREGRDMGVMGEAKPPSVWGPEMMIARVSLAEHPRAVSWFGTYTACRPLFPPPGALLAERPLESPRAGILAAGPLGAQTPGPRRRGTTAHGRHAAGFLHAPAAQPRGVPHRTTALCGSRHHSRRRPRQPNGLGGARAHRPPSFARVHGARVCARRRGTAGLVRISAPASTGDAGLEAPLAPRCLCAAGHHGLLGWHRSLCRVPAVEARAAGAVDGNMCALCDRRANSACERLAGPQDIPGARGKLVRVRVGHRVVTAQS